MMRTVVNTFILARATLFPIFICFLCLNTYQDAYSQLKNQTVEINGLTEEILIKTIQPIYSNGRSYCVNYTSKVPSQPNVVVEKRRGLGDTDAPLWMVYTLIVLLSVVWFHYLYVFFIMYKINRLRSNKEV